jgi:hypothetical protein
VACLAAAGPTEEAKAVLATIASQCAHIGSFRYLPDGGPYVAATLTALHQDQQNGALAPRMAGGARRLPRQVGQCQVVHTI